eukprot:CAMPEP_0172540444 /NCGR_PEP_ID=MMETSP1067-20121228/11466_1 /TAXON_ID=265564 ORGANISM="Thalassiosira punctigera, Strain Tpunct2005C2" /NCGR_SAMPLE_ID=MMETSP1067 /ASSEMBLY_ACC=CAM_ASM_000444 /LENGTH=297 /DNA_ID=CAMNT_0013326307 /DNA_START=185 /DNA_END=1078 /DNA_ORIENTATION=+
MVLGTKARTPYELATLQKWGRPREESDSAQARISQDPQDAAVHDAAEISDDESADARGPEERSYGDFLSYVDFVSLVEYLGVLMSKSPSPPAVAPAEESPGDELERLMRETPVEDQEGRMASFGKWIRVLMGAKPASDGSEGDREVDDEFLKILNAPPSRDFNSLAASLNDMDEKDREETWAKIAEGMAPKEERCTAKILEAAYWRYIVNDGFPEKEEGWRGWFWSMLGYTSAYDIEVRGSKGEQAKGQVKEQPKGVKEQPRGTKGDASEADTNSVSSSACEKAVVVEGAMALGGVV